MFGRSTKRSLFLAALCMSSTTAAAIHAAETASRTKEKPEIAEVELFKAENEDKIEIEFSAPAADHAFVRIENKTDQMLHIRLPSTFAGVPVLGQFGGAPIGGGQFGGGQLGGGQFGGGLFGGGQQGGLPGGGQFGGNQGFGNNQGNQGLGGGFGQGNAGGNGIGNFMGNRGGGNFRLGNPGFGNPGLGNLGFGNPGLGGMFRVAPGKTGKLPVNTVCLEHGKPDPNSRVKYRLVPLQQFNTDPRIEVVCSKLGSGEISQHVAQCAAWHITDGLSWDELAAKNRVESRYTGNVKFFSQEEMNQAMQLVSGLEAVVKPTTETNYSTATVTSPSKTDPLFIEP